MKIGAFFLYRRARVPSPATRENARACRSSRSIFLCFLVSWRLCILQTRLFNENWTTEPLSHREGNGSDHSSVAQCPRGSKLTQKIRVCDPWNPWFKDFRMKSVFGILHQYRAWLVMRCRWCPRAAFASGCEKRCLSPNLNCALNVSIISA